MKKRLFAMFLALTMALSLMPAALAAEEPDGETQASVEAPQNQGPETPSEGNTTYVAEVNGQPYETLQKAIDAANSNETILLLTNISGEEIGSGNQMVFDEGESNKNITINLQGNTVTASAGEAVSIKANALTLTIMNGKIVNKNDGQYSDGIYAYCNANGSEDSRSHNLNLTLNGVEFETKTQSISINGTAKNTNLVISNCNIVSTDEIGIYYPPDGVLEIVDTTITAPTGIAIKGGTVTIGGNTKISANGEKVVPSQPYPGSGNLTLTGDAIYFEGGYSFPMVLNITGGTFKSENGYAVQMNFKNAPENPPVRKISITGGTFSSDVSAYLAKGYVQNANGEVGKLNDVAVAEVTTADGTTNKYETLQKAIADVEENGTVTLLRDVTETDKCVVNNGHTFTMDLGTNTLTVNKRLIVQSGFVTVKNGTLAGDVELSAAAEDKAFNSFTLAEDAVIRTDGWGIMIFQNGTTGGAYNFGTTVNVDGKIYGKESALWVLGNIHTDLTSAQNPVTVNVGSTAVMENDSPGTTALQMAGSCVVTIADGAQITADTAVEVRAGRLTVNGGTITGTGTPTTVNSNGNGTSTTGVGIAVAQHQTALPITVIVNGGTISGFTGFYVTNPENRGNADKVQATLNGGYFAAINGGSNAAAKDNNAEQMQLTITGGYFTSDPSAYCADGLTGIASGRADYPFTVGEKAANKAEVAVAEPEISTQLPGNASEEEKELAEKTETALTQAADSAAITGPAMDAAAVQQANQNQVTRKAAESALTSGGIGIQGQEVKVVIQTYMDIKITDASVEKDGDVVTKQTLTLDITPMYKTVATTAADLGQIETSGDQKNAVEITTAGTSGVLKNITGPVQVSIPLPAGFVTGTDAKVYVHHKGYEYAATVSQVGQDGSQTFVATFTNPHGFSKFTLSTTSAAVAKVNGDSYTSFQDAVNAAGSNDTIEVLQAGSYTASAGKTVKVKNAAGGEDITVTINGETKTVSKDETVAFTYVPPVTPPQPDDRPSGGSDSSSSSDGDYIVSVDTGKHGTVTVSPKRADKGDTVTITVKPDKGYELDKLVVTDKNGDAVKLKDKGNGKFSFTMPGSKVTVEAKFVKESASQLPFADVSADYWAYDEIAWAYENGYMNGTSATAFNPGGNVSRQQLWMILARLSGASPASMAEAREWAIGNGISDGSNPGGAISRQQMVATLYRYAKLMGYDTTGAADLTAFPDHASVADYAKEAMAWSVKNEIVGGTAQGTLNPAGTASRAQFAVILYRFVK